ncbi:MAG: bifunctional 5,10-methylenetetrahydrofolate dehydrogenase/5,10-methenyltetrahydrofolate cyclohydrolase [Planctomycetaceae bacterium]|jgi:methylenetetrahydrofolate dehydrogenase (NADP+)/methenyltetrahydrofolate cyclohydrolase|nr:bifunctional 5,10-methylenetetrahydrofolate dehydrogenase/5,10-methenyltetrahydrofolate cyclohydrolase [Planctomycetaceae bacterium]
MQLLDGKKLSETILNELAEDVIRFKTSTGITPCLAAVLAGDDPASRIYISNKEKNCRKIGMESRLFHLPATTTTEELLVLIEKLNTDLGVHGILVQLPLPQGCNTLRVLDAIDPKKDVDAFHPENVGLISQGRPRYLPCTPYGIQQMLVRYGIETSGKHAVIVGRSDIVGKPLALILVQKQSPQQTGADAAVSIVHSRTKNLHEITRQADILIAAIGQPRFLTAEMVKPGAVVIDVGINRLPDGKICGDVDFDTVKRVAGAISPVPGGVGPLTISMLLLNTLRAANLLNQQKNKE